jgi:DnaJ homolog subfamily C member 17
MPLEFPPDLDIYDFLSIAPTSTESEIRKAYRKLSRLYHPDKNPSSEAVEKFHLLTLAVTILSSPTARTAYDNVRKAKAAKAARTAQYDDERRRMQRDLEDRERAAKRRRFDMKGIEEEERIFKQEVEKLKEASERLKKERDKRIRENLERELQNEAFADESERTIKVKFRKGADRSQLSADLIEDIFLRYGDIENVLLGKSALIVFETVSGAKAALSNFMKSNGPGTDMIKEVAMAQNLSNDDVSSKDSTHGNEESRKSSIPQTNVTIKDAPTAAPKFSFKPTGDMGNAADYESITLLRMRKIEKERLEREIREQEEKEE